MNKKGLMSIFIAALMLASMLSVFPAEVGAQATTLRCRFTDVNAYDRLSVIEDPAGDYRKPTKSFTVLWIVEDVAHLGTWGGAMTWNSSILECTSAAYGPTFKAVDPAAMQMSFSITAGKIELPGEALTTGEVNKGVYPNAAILFTAKFQVKSYGSTGLNFTGTSLLDTSLAEIPRTEINGLFDNTDLKTPPSSPVAAFSFLPPAAGPYPGVWSFNASTSEPGFNGTKECPVTEYIWRWGDGTLDTLTASPTITHEFTIDGTFSVNLTVYAPPEIPGFYYPYGSTVEPITVYASPRGPLIDIYTQKEPYSGRGLNQPSDAFAPDEKVILYAEATYNLAPAPERLMAYVVFDPEGNLVATETAITDANGIANMSFRLTPVFGTWNAMAVVELAGEIVNDSLTFKVGWIMEIVSLATINENLQPQMEFGRGSCVGVELVIRNIAMTSRDATLTVVAYDSLGVPINSLELNDFKVKPGETRVPIYCKLQIPKWAVVGLATLTANAYTAPLALGGKPYCPEVSANFLITFGRDVSVISVTPSASEVYVGEVIEIFVVVKNEGFKTESFNVTAYYNTTGIETQTVTDLTSGTSRTLTFSWNTSGVPEGSYVIGAVASLVPEEVDVKDNTCVDGFVAVVAKPSPQPPPSPSPVSVFSRELFILGLLVAAAIVATIVAFLLWRRRKKKSPS